MYIRSVIQAYKLVHNNVLRGAQGWTCRHATLVGGTEPCVQETPAHSVSTTNIIVKKCLQRATQSGREWKWDKYGVICPACSDLSRLQRALTS